MIFVILLYCIFVTLFIDINNVILLLKSNKIYVFIQYFLITYF